MAFKEYMIAGKTLLNYINLFLSNDYEQNYKIPYTLKTNMAKKCKP